MVLSWALAALITASNGRPLRSHSTWYLVPALPRSVGLGPVSSPLRLARTLTLSIAARDQPATRVDRADQAHCGATAPTPQPVATVEAAASKSLPSRSPAPQADRSNRCRSATRTRSRQTRQGADTVGVDSRG